MQHGVIISLSSIYVMIKKRFLLNQHCDTWGLLHFDVRRWVKMAKNKKKIRCVELTRPY